VAVADAEAPKQQVPVKDPDGKLGTVAPEDVQNALASGYSYATPEEWQAAGEENRKAKAYGESPGLAALEGAGRGFLPGVVPYAERHLLGVSQEALKERKERNPWAAGAGEFGGVVAGTALGDELGLGAKVGEAAGLGEAVEGGATVAKTIGGTAKSYAEDAAKSAAKDEIKSALGEAEPEAAKVTAEATPLARRIGKAAGVNAGYGAGQAVNEGELGEAPLTGQSVLAGAGMGALLGAGGEGLFALGERAAPSVLSAASDATDKLGAKAANLFDNFHAWKSDMPVEEIRAARQAGLAQGPEAFGSEALKAEKEAAKVATVASKVGYKEGLTGAAKDLSDTLNETETHNSQLLREVNGKARPEQIQNLTFDHPVEQSVASAKDFIAQSQKKLEEMAANPIHQAGAMGTAGKLLTNLEEDIGNAGTTAEVHDLINGFKQDLDSQLKFGIATSPAEKGTLNELKSIRTGAKDLLEDPFAMGKAGEKTAAWNAAQSSFFQARKTLLKSLGQNVETASGGVTKEIKPGRIEAMLKGGSVNHPLGIAGSKAEELQGNIDRYLEASKNLHAEAGAVYKDTSLTAPDPDELRGLLEHVTGKRQAAAEAIANVPQKVLPSGPATTMNALRGGKLGQAIGEGKGMESLGIAGVGAHALGLPVGPAIAAVGAYKLATNTAKQIETLARINQVVQRVKAIISSGAAAFVRSGAGSVARGTIERAGTMAALSGAHRDHMRGSEDIDKRSAELDSLTTNPALLANTLQRNSSRLQEAAPNLTMQAHTAVARGLVYLQSAKPKNPTAPGLIPATEKWTPPESQVAQYQQIHNVVSKPLTVLDHLRSGTLTPAMVEAVKATVPDLHAAMCHELTQQVMAHPKSAAKMDYQSKLQLALFLGHPIDFATSPEFAKALQGPPSPPPGAPPPAGQKSVRPSQAGLKNLDFAGSAATPSQARMQNAKQA
jgi:hypothetical protein